MVDQITGSGDIVRCFENNDPHRCINLTHYPDGTVVADCTFLKCIFFDRCKLSENTSVKNYVETTEAKARGF